MKYKYNGQWVDVNIKALDSMVIGSIIQFVGTTIPTGWLECDGSTITQSAYPELYDLIGGTLPDFRGKVLVGQDTNDTDFDTLLETGGEKSVQLTTDNLASNTINTATTGSNADGYIMRGGYTATGTYNIGGSGVAHNNLQPYAVVKHIIKAKNTTPTMASVVNTYNTSTTDTYSCKYINNANAYSTSEVKTDMTWIDGKPIYRKVYEVQSLANSGRVSIPLGITYDKVLTVNGYFTNGTNILACNFPSQTDLTYTIKTFIESSYIHIDTGSDRSSYYGYVWLEYTKTTD